jgi:hypothetical protein
VYTYFELRVWKREWKHPEEIIIMLSGKLLRQTLDKFMKGEVAQNARVQVVLPDGQFYDITGLQLMENKLIGVRESHRLVLTIQPEQWKMGKVIKKV